LLPVDKRETKHITKQYLLLESTAVEQRSLDEVFKVVQGMSVKDQYLEMIGAIMLEHRTNVTNIRPINTYPLRRLPINS
jgi:hypothetical protein